VPQDRETPMCSRFFRVPAAPESKDE
jgi:hypothetical protein